MHLNIPYLRRFLYGHYFFGGIRQAVGMLLPAILGSFFGHFALGIVATLGALCLAIIDQPGGPQRHLPGEMLAGAFICTASVAVTGLASTHPALLWLAVIAQCFFLSMFTVFGRRGSLMAFGGLLLMTLTMHTPMPPELVLTDTVATLAGALFYLCFSMLTRSMMMLYAERQTLAAALFATADYVAVRSRFYDETTDLDEVYRLLIRSQSAMSEKHQFARDNVLRALPKGNSHGNADRIMIWNIFVDMLQLRDTLLATYTDYALLRRTLAGQDALIFMRDALRKMSIELDRIALDVSRNHATHYRNSTKAELLAIEYEIEKLRQRKDGQPEPEAISLIVLVLRRLRNAARILDRIAAHTLKSPDAQPTDALRIDKTLTQFMTRQRPSLSMITRNLRLDSPHCRYAIRISLAAALGMLLTAGWVPSQHFAAHSYWVVLTIIIIMKPGFALTRQRNFSRLTGTLIGCLLAPAVLLVTAKAPLIFAVMLLACALGNSLAQLNYLASSLFTTLYVVLAYHFLSPETVSLEVISERALDTLLGSALSLVCSYVLPWWESRSMRPLALDTVRTNRDYLRTGLRYVRAEAEYAGAADDNTRAALAPAVADADLAWRLARKNVHNAFSNFTEAFYRMMQEPRSHQVHVPELNHLLIQNHVLALQTTAVIPLLAGRAGMPPALEQSLEYIVRQLDEGSPAPADPPAPYEAEGELLTLAYPVKQMLRASETIRQELAALGTPPPSLAVQAAAG
ncbi:MAG TPA: FUSC family membrane protein [Bordetella sp.]|uniref:FUSC family protein n=1 Tax=Bordetella sp. TaxID=28081 RepID=UPI002ED508F4